MPHTMRVWAPRAHEGQPGGGRGRPPDVRRRRRLVDGAGAGFPDRLRIPARRRPHGPARPAIPLAAGGRRRADPARSTPSTYRWGDAAWTGRRLAGSMIYELHLGTFTPEGTLDAAIGKLDHLVSIGVDMVELLPVNAFSGTRNWGYDGVLWFAVQESYGGPRAYQRFVDACHQRGIGVIQDVVYNHLGAGGNHLPLFGPYLNAGRRRQHRGASRINLDGADSGEVRRYILDNVVMWLQRLPCRRPAAGRRARAERQPGHAPARGASPSEVDALAAARAPAAVADRRVRPERPEADHPAGGRRLRADGAVERRLPPRAARCPDR